MKNKDYFMKIMFLLVFLWSFVSVEAQSWKRPEVASQWFFGAHTNQNVFLCNLSQLPMSHNIHYAT